MDKISIKFPDSSIKEYECGKPVVILGSNGSGKTRLSVKLEELNSTGYSNAFERDKLLVHRISAQKSLSLSNSVSIKGFEASEREAYIGNVSSMARKINSRYRNNPTTSLLDDYNQIMSLFFSKNNKRLEEQHKLDVIAFESGVNRDAPIKTLVDRLEGIWNEILPNCKIDLTGNEVHVVGEYNYHGQEMSDGERVILYMMMQVLSVKEYSVIIIDEPELHIHKAILESLWNKLETIRQDCVFMYITHDLEFAITRNASDIIWLKKYNVNSWEYEHLVSDNYDDLPGDLLFELLGAKKKVVFVEGLKSSYDYILYKEILEQENYHVIPCGGCSEVINYVKAKNGYDSFKHIEVYGIIDRDYRTENEIRLLEEQGIFCLKVAEVENLFVVPELLHIMQRKLGCDENSYNDAVNFIINIYNGIKPKLISEAFIREIDHQLNCLHFETSDMTATKVKEAIDSSFTNDNIEKILEEKKLLFNSKNELQDILELMNFKELSKKIGTKFGINDRDYPNRVINYLKYSDAREDIVNAIKPYIPTLP